MPWEIEIRGSQFCVVKEGTSESVGCHDTREGAEAQRQALYANEPTARQAAISDAFPLDPPAEWFTTLPDWFEPGMKLTVCTSGPEAGRVAATVAPRGQCILGSEPGGECWTAPFSPTAYSAAMQGDTPTAEGLIIKTANLAADINHVNPRASFREAVDVMANTGAQVARVRYADLDGHIVALGSAWPGLSDVQVRKMQASALSGDWRWREELAAYDFAGSILVSCPGFPLMNRPDHPVFAPVAASLEMPHPPIVGSWVDTTEVPMPEPATTTATCATCHGLVVVPARTASNNTVVVSAPATPCSCHTAAAPPMLPPEGEALVEGEVVSRAEFDALRDEVAMLSEMVVGGELSKLDAEVAALPEPVALA